MAAVTIFSDFGTQEYKICPYFHFFPIYLPWSDGTGCHDLSFLNVEFQASFFTHLFHLHQEVTQSCLTLFDPLDCSLPGSSIHGIFQAEYWIGVPLLSPMTNVDSILKSRDITLPTKVHQVKDMAFLIVMYGCDSWTIKKAEHWRTDAFKLWYWRSLSHFFSFLDL